KQVQPGSSHSTRDSETRAVPGRPVFCSTFSVFRSRQHLFNWKLKTNCTVFRGKVVEEHWPLYGNEDFSPGSVCHDLYPPRCSEPGGNCAPRASSIVRRQGHRPC
ncbi:unnamed protein product, partial [Discosporangium mesarthrocarpum]